MTKTKQSKKQWTPPGFKFYACATFGGVLGLAPDRLLGFVLERLLERLPPDMARALPAFATRERANLLADLTALAVRTDDKAERRTS